ncbi:uncharacterized protein G2W53_028933 [Senna tora]|uniref:Uncharacterized protein n=1 Tax=Senna tora TaxID=362788 RepID=A0A834TD46_9FABA|nr:uncharacterized protein G2W53_028933 [Senna tora]
MPYQSLGLDASFLGLKILGISMPCQSPGVLMPCQSPGLDTWLFGFKISGISMACQFPGLDAWFLGFKISGVSMPSQSPCLDAWDLDALPSPVVSMPCQSQGLNALFLGFKISGVSMPCQSLGSILELIFPYVEKYILPRHAPLKLRRISHSEGIGNSMEERIPEATEKVSIKIALSDSVDNLIDNGGLP